MMYANLAKMNDHRAVVVDLAKMRVKGSVGHGFGWIELTMKHGYVFGYGYGTMVLQFLKN